MKDWSETRSEIRSISDLEIAQLDLSAQLVSMIVNRRKELKITQRQLAEMAQLKQSTIARMESGGILPRLETLFKIAHSLKLKVVLVPDELAAARAVG